MTALRKRDGGRFAKLLGSFWRSPKVHALSPEARALYCAGLSYAADLATDGKVPKYMVPALHAGMPPALPVAMLCASVNGECPFWYDRGDYYEIHDYLEENPSRSELEALSERGREKAARRWKQSSRPVAADAACNAPGNAASDAIPNPKSQIPNLNPKSQSTHPRASEPKEPKPRAARQATDAQVRGAVADAMGEALGCRVPDDADLFGLVQRSFGELLKAKTGQSWRRGSKDWGHISALVEWARGVAADDGVAPEQALAESLEGFAADAWAKSRGWPLGAWASGPSKYRAQATALPPPPELSPADREARRAWLYSQWVVPMQEGKTDAEIAEECGGMCPATEIERMGYPRPKNPNNASSAA